ncbi:MAG: S-adenosylmethionine:tRNA ribosyltransferase-isomerase, partial [Odoribacter sp.]|nr:S-adenosylmethionine:tRNA ribosyltransferase-isomerase [Odoribacter sp.]
GVEELLEPGQTLVFNNTKVIHARIFFRKPTGAVIEVFCLEPCRPSDYAQNFAAREECEWSCMVGNLKKWKEGRVECRFTYKGQECVLTAEKREQTGGEVIVRFSWDGGLAFSEVLEGCGSIPIPPYLNRDSEASDEIRYQTVYSKEEGSVAAPTAGLHFTDDILGRLGARGVGSLELTLHVGAGTFRPVKAETIGGHDMHTEHLVISRKLVECLKQKEKEIIAVGTTSVRTLESLYWMGVKRLEGVEDFFALGQWEAYTLPSHYTLRQAMEALEGWFDETGRELLKARTTIIIVPGYCFRVLDAMFTNFHQPQSTLLLLVAAAVGEEWHRIYGYALTHGFRFLSYGDS